MERPADRSHPGPRSSRVDKGRESLTQDGGSGKPCQSATMPRARLTNGCFVQHPRSNMAIVYHIWPLSGGTCSFGVCASQCAHNNLSSVRDLFDHEQRAALNTFRQSPQHLRLNGAGYEVTLNVLRTVSLGVPFKQVRAAIVVLKPVKNQPFSQEP